MDERIGFPSAVDGAALSSREIISAKWRLCWSRTPLICSMSCRIFAVATCVISCLRSHTSEALIGAASPTSSPGSRMPGGLDPRLSGVTLAGLLHLWPHELSPNIGRADAGASAGNATDVRSGRGGISLLLPPSVGIENPYDRCRVERLQLGGEERMAERGG